MYKLHPCMCIWIQPVMVYHYPGPCICTGRLLFVVLWVFFSLLSCIPVMFTGLFSLSLSFSIMECQKPAVRLIMGIVNVIYGTFDFSLFSITKEMQNKWLVVALLCKITVNWVCSGKCIVTVDCKLKNIEKYKINRTCNGFCGCMIELLKN